MVCVEVLDMPWLAKSDVEIPTVYGSTDPFVHWAAPNKVVIIWGCYNGELLNNIYAWPIVVDTTTGALVGPDVADIYQIGSFADDNESITRVESMADGGYVLHTEIAGEG